jgi:hypothetical protein
MNEKTLRAQALVKQIEQNVAELNALLEDLDYTLLRAAGLQVRYAWGGCGSPWAGLGTKPIIPEREEHRRATYIPPYVEDREYSRGRLRSQGFPEPMIWERFPPKTPQEEEERIDRIRTYEARKSVKIAREVAKASPFDAWLQVQARKEARVSRREYAVVMKDEEFLERAKNLWNVINTELDLGI